MSDENITRGAGAPLQIDILDVGHGDSICIMFPDGYSFGIIDSHIAGFNGDGLTNQEVDVGPRALEIIRSRSAGLSDVERKRLAVEFVCLTHPHGDHYTGLASVMRHCESLNIPVHEYWETEINGRYADAMSRIAKYPEQWDELHELERLTAEVKRREGAAGLLSREIRASDHPFLEKAGVTLYALAPSVARCKEYRAFLMLTQAQKRASLRKNARLGIEGENGVSAAFLLTYGRARVILAGDITNDVWDEIIGRGVDIHCAAIKVSHHGSKEGSHPTTAVLWQRLQALGGPGIAVISGGYRKSLPHAKTLEGLRAAHWRVFMTGDPSKYSETEFVLRSAEQRCQSQLRLEGIVAPVLGAAQKHGNIRLACYENGAIDVSCEHV